MGISILSVPWEMKYFENLVHSSIQSRLILQLYTFQILLATSTIFRLYSFVYPLESVLFTRL